MQILAASEAAQEQTQQKASAKVYTTQKLSFLGVKDPEKASAALKKAATVKENLSEEENAFVKAAYTKIKAFEAAMPTQQPAQRTEHKPETRLGKALRSIKSAFVR